MIPDSASGQDRGSIAGTPPEAGSAVSL